MIVYNADRTWDFTAQGVGSLLTGHTPDTLRDGTYRGETVSGYAASTRIHHSEEYWAAALNTDLLSPGFTVNDLGFMPRANMFRGMGYVAVRDPHPNDKWQSWQAITGAREVTDYRFAHRLIADAFLEGWVTTKSFWFVDTGFDAFAPYVDDRELYDGTPLERQAALQWYGFMNTDSRKPVQLQLSWTVQRSFPRFERLNQIGPSLVFRPMPQLDGQLDLSFNESAGTIRKIAVPAISPDTTQTRVYLLAPQQARSLSATLRATYAFTPYLTLQAYTQLFTADIAYGGPLRAVVGPGRRTVSLGELRPALPEDQAPNNDERQIGLNVNLILRYEWRTGSTFYLVYAHQSSNDLLPPPGPRGLNFGQELSALSAPGVAHGDTVLVKMDLLSAL